MPRTPRVIFAVFALAVAAGGRARADDVKVTLHLQADAVAPEESVAAILTIQNPPGGDVTMPDFGALQVRGPNKSDSASAVISGGQRRIQRSVTFTWSVWAKKPGKYPIGPGKLTYDGKEYVSNAVTLVVDPRVGVPLPDDSDDEAEAAADDLRRRRNPFAAPAQPFPDDPFDILDQFDRWGGSGDAWRKPTEGDVFLRAIIDRPEAWLGEQVTLSLYLFSQVDVQRVDTTSFPKLDGFWTEELETVSRLSPELRTLKGVTYRAYLLRRRALFPLRAGELVIDPVEVSVTLAPMMFFGAPTEVVKRRSPSLAIKVKELPAEGQPPGFDVGSVGAFRIESSLTPQQTTLGNPVTLRVSVEGRGNVKGVHLPKLKLPEGLKAFDPTVTDKVELEGTQFGGTKTLEWVVVPERTGQFELPAIEWPVFLPVEGTYDTLATQPLTLAVVGPAAAAPVPSAATQGAVPPTAVNVLSGGLRPIRLQGDVSLRSPEPPWARGWFWGLVLGPVVLWFARGVSGGLSSAFARKDDAASREKRAKGAASKRLKGAEELLRGDDSDALYAEISRALHAFLADRCRIPAQGLVRTELVAALVALGVPDEVAKRCAVVLETCETARYAPLARESTEKRRVLEAAREVIDAIDGVKGGAA